MSLLRDALLVQLDIAWKLLQYHLESLTDEECLWRPAAQGLHLTEENGVWRAQWPESEGYHTGPPSIAWLTWHIGYWWSTALSHAFGDGSLQRHQVVWPDSVDGVRRWLDGLHREWLGKVSQLTDEDLASTGCTRWPFENRPFAEVVGWLNLELMKNAAEIGYARFLYHARGANPS